MERKIRKPIPTSCMVSCGLIILGGILIGNEEMTSGVLSLVLAGMLLGINGILLPTSTLFMKKKLSKKEVDRYRNFAKFYLKDRRLLYSKQTFEKAIDANWYDVVTMCLLLGIKEAYEPYERQTFVVQALRNSHARIYEMLLRGGMGGHFIVEDTGEHLVFETLKQSDAKYLSFLLACHISPDIMNQEGDYPIFRAIKEDAVDHVRVLLQHKCSLEVTNKEKLTPLFYALKEGKVTCCELIAEAMEKEDEPHEISVKKLKEPLLVNAPVVEEESKLLLHLIASKDKTTLELLKRYFMNPKQFYMKAETDVALYARLSAIEAVMEKKEMTSSQVEHMYTEEACKKELYGKVLKTYRFTKTGDFVLESLYKTPRCIDSYKEACETCKGQGSVPCTACKATGVEVCEKCKGTGEIVCEKCKGTLKASCETVKKYIECQNCKDGLFICVKCDKEGMQPCPTCGGHGTTKCKCPPDKKKKCPHCDRGYIPLKSGMYKKCAHCHDGEICMICHNTGWVDEKFKKQGFECKTCKGEKKIPCQICNGKKKVKCSKRFEIACDCETGKQVCPECEGSTKVACKVCEGTKRQKCTECTDGYKYTNVYVDFKAKQSMVKEVVLHKGEKDDYLEDMLHQMGGYMTSNSSYIKELYTMFQIDMRPEDVVIRNHALNDSIHQLIREKSKKGILDVLEIAPLAYTIVRFKEKEGATYECILVGEKFYKTLTK